MSLAFTKLRSPTDDPLSSNNRFNEKYNDDNNDRNSATTKVKTESLTIRLSDEVRIAAAMVDASKKKTFGVIFAVRIDISKASSLCIGVKDLQDKLLAVSMLKRIEGGPGPVETAGIRLGDIIFGVNFHPCRDGSKTLLHTVKKDMERGRRTLHLQVRFLKIN